MLLSVSMSLEVRGRPGALKVLGWGFRPMETLTLEVSPEENSPDFCTMYIHSNGLVTSICW